MSNKSINKGFITRWHFIHWIGYGIERVVSFFLGQALRLFPLPGIDYFLVTGELPQRLKDALVTPFDEAIDIKIAIGELDHRIMEDSMILDGLRKAQERNNANIEIVQGPIVDAKTHTIYEMSARNALAIFRSDQNYPHNFILLTNSDGQVTIVELSRHYDMPKLRTNQNVDFEPFRNHALSFYIRSGSGFRATTLMRVFRNRKTISIRIYEFPKSNIPLSTPTKFIWQTQEPSIPAKGAYLLVLALLKLLLQPAAVIFDRAWDIDFHEWAIAFHQRVKKMAFRYDDLFSKDLDVPYRVKKFTAYPYGPEMKQLQSDTQKSRPSAQVTIHDIMAFHRLEYGEKSVANLVIQPDTFLKLVEVGQNRVDRLDRRIINLSAAAQDELDHALETYQRQMRRVAVNELTFTGNEIHPVRS